MIALSADEREKAWESFENEVLFASGKGAEYILTHLPKPVLVNRSLDLKYWRFAGDKEWVFSDEYPLEALKENLGLMFKRLSDISNRYNIQIFLENDAMSEVLTESRLLVDLLRENNKVKLCLDCRDSSSELLFMTYNLYSVYFTNGHNPFVYIELRQILYDEWRIIDNMLYIN